jgi:hypothetical protein
MIRGKYKINVKHTKIDMIKHIDFRLSVVDEKKSRPLYDVYSWCEAFSFILIFRNQTTEDYTTRHPRNARISLASPVEGARSKQQRAREAGLT